LSDHFLIPNGLKQEDALSPLPFNTASKYAVKEVQEPPLSINKFQGMENTLCCQTTYMQQLCLILYGYNAAVF
jgi:hypothetical protein